MSRPQNSDEWFRLLDRLVAAAWLNRMDEAARIDEQAGARAAGRLFADWDPDPFGRESKGQDYDPFVIQTVEKAKEAMREDREKRLSGCSLSLRRETPNCKPYPASWDNLDEEFPFDSLPF